jgi:HPt (histidine-containing phosphotransfer) domain-containing protein
VPSDSAQAGVAGSHQPANSRASSSVKSTHAGNPKFMAIIPQFVAGLPGKVGKMTDLLRHKDLDGLRRLAHQLLGTCGGYGFHPVSEPARTVEQSIKAGHALELITPEVKSLIEVIRRIDGYDESKEAAPAEELK